MKKQFFKKARIGSFVLAFGLLTASALSLVSALNASATGGTDGENQEAEERWINYDPEGEIYSVGDAQENFDGLHADRELLGANANDDGIVTITMHVKEGEGHFEGEENPQIHSKSYYFRDLYIDYTEPVSDRGNGYVFAGWSSREEADAVDITVGNVAAGRIPSDIYAVWSDKAYVYYHIPSGYWEYQGQAYQHIMAEYDAGAEFQLLKNPDPVPFEDDTYVYAGWYTELFGRGEEIREGDPVTAYELDVYLAWNYDTDAIDALELNTPEHVEVGYQSPVLKFTPEEDGIYEIYTDGIVSDPSSEDTLYQGMLRIRDLWDHGLAIESQMDPSEGWGDVHAYLEMEAGTTYYIRLDEAGGHDIDFNVLVRKSQMVDVTFDADKDGLYNGHFDGDPEQTTKVVSLPVGYDIKSKSIPGLEYDDENFAFGVWKTNPDDGHSWLLVTEDLDYVYASYVEMITVHLDYNGGHHPYYPEEHTYDAKFMPGKTFETPIDPVVDDPALAFAGWAFESDATEPDPEITEGATDAEAFKNQTLYAVYSQKAPVTFVVNGGGYMADDPNLTVYETSYGIGHIFYGMAVMHDNPRVKHSGWVDQDGVRTYMTDGVDGRYRIHGETTFTAVLNYEVLVDGNGGLLPNGGFGPAEEIRVEIPYEDEDSTFSIEDALERTGEPYLPDDDTKEFAGFATTPNATEPDVDDDTLLIDLDTVYVVWKDKEEPEPEPTPASDDEPEAPEVPNTGANTITAERVTVTTYASLGLALLAPIVFGATRLFRKRRI